MLLLFCFSSVLNWADLPLYLEVHRNLEQLLVVSDLSYLPHREGEVQVHILPPRRLGCSRGKHTWISYCPASAGTHRGRGVCAAGSGWTGTRPSSPPPPTRCRGAPRSGGAGNRKYKSSLHPSLPGTAPMLSTTDCNHSWPTQFLMSKLILCTNMNKNNCSGE